MSKCRNKLMKLSSEMAERGIKEGLMKEVYLVKRPVNGSSSNRFGFFCGHWAIQFVEKTYYVILEKFDKREDGGLNWVAFNIDCPLPLTFVRVKRM